MTISSSTRKAGPFTGNGVTTSFPFTFKVFTASDLYVVLADTSTGIETVQTLTTNYTVSLNADQNANPGGSVVMLTAPAAGYTLTLTSAIAQTQAVDLQNAGGFYPSVINSALDKLTILIQQMQTYLTGALKLPLSAGSNVSATLPTPSGGKLLGWAADGLSIQNLDASGVGAGTIGTTQLADGGVTTAKIADANVTAAKLAAGAAAANIGYTPANDTLVAKLGTAQQFTARQRTAPVTDNDLSLDLAAANDFVCTPTAGGTLTFTNITAGCKGEILLVNNSNYAIAKAAAVKCPSSMLTTISATGRYRLAYSSLDGTNVDVTASAALS